MLMMTDHTADTLDIHPLPANEKASILIEALPYIQRFSGSTVVIKLGGASLVHPEKKLKMLQDVALLHMVGIRCVIVHGGGPAINQHLRELGHESHFENGVRVTDEITMSVAEMVLSGQVGKDLAAQLGQLGVQALSLSGKDGQLLQCKRTTINGMDVGLVGEVESVNIQLLNTLLDNNLIPVISTIGIGADGTTYNVNADFAVIAVAAALKAKKLVFMTDVAGVLANVNDPASRIGQLSLGQVEGLIAAGVISGGMIPKVSCCVEAVQQGVEKVHILDGRVEHSLLVEIFTDEGIGTLVTA
jgi:acetylglutamate kinase